MKTDESGPNPADQQAAPFVQRTNPAKHTVMVVVGIVMAYLLIAYLIPSRA